MTSRRKSPNERKAKIVKREGADDEYIKDPDTSMASGSCALRSSMPGGHRDWSRHRSAHRVAHLAHKAECGPHRHLGTVLGADEYRLSGPWRSREGEGARAYHGIHREVKEVDGEEVTTQSLSGPVAYARLFSTKTARHGSHILASTGCSLSQQE